MTKQDIMDTLQDAKTAHIRLHACGEALVIGAESCEIETPSSHYDCDFGKWYYSIGQLLNFARNYSSIESVHESVHTSYDEIYNKYFNEAPSAKKNFEMKKLLYKLKEVSRLFILEVENVERQLEKMTPQQIASRIMAKDYQYIL